MAMTQNYLAGEVSLLLAKLQAVARDPTRAREAARLRREAETRPIPLLPAVVVRALELGRRPVLGLACPRRHESICGSSRCLSCTRRIRRARPPTRLHIVLRMLADRRDELGRARNLSELVAAEQS